MTRSRVLAVCTLALLTLAACGSDITPSASPTTAGSTEPSSPAATAAATFPVTIMNCGTSYTFSQPPTRAVTMNQHVTEILLALGLERSMVATAYLDSTIRPDLQTAYDHVPVLAKEYPSKEQVLATSPDLVVGGFASAFGDTAAGDRTALKDLGVNTFLTSGYCPDFAQPNSVNLVEQDIRDLGAVFGVPDKAAAVIGAIDAPIATAQRAVAGTTPPKVFVYDSGTDKAFTAAGDEMTTALINLAGGRNIFDNVHKSFTEVSWEDVVAGDPDVVVILNYGDTSAAQKEDLLASHPVASTLRAVRQKRFVVVDLTDVVPGIRNGDTVLALAKGFHPDRF